MNDQGQRLQIFLCHAHEDKTIVRELCRWLKEDGHQPWLDEEDLLPGQNWLLAIQDAIRASHVFLVCLTPNSVQKTGAVQREIKLAIDAATERPEEDIYVIPCRLAECDVPRGLRHWQWVDLFDDQGRERLNRSLEKRSVELALQASPAQADESSEQADAGGKTGDGLSEAFEWIMHVSGTTARNGVEAIHEGYEIRKGRTTTEDLVEWLIEAMEERYKSLDGAEGPEGDDIVAERLKIIGMATDFAAASFSKALRSIREFMTFESDSSARERYVLDRLDQILIEWQDYGLDRHGGS